MKASIIDLRYNMKYVLEALERREEVTVLYHGKEKGVIKPVDTQKEKSVSEHPFFGMLQDSDESTEQIMERLRGGRY